MVSLPFGGDMVLWTTPDKFYVSSEESPSRLMLIDRVTGQATVEPYRHQIPSIVGRKNIAGVLGIINLVSGPHLVIAVSKRKIGHLTSDNHAIWMLDGVSIVSLARSDLHLRVEQRESVLEQRKMIEELFNTPYFYFSHTLDLTNCQQKLDGLIENDAKGYFVLGTATPAFTWNYFMLRSGGFAQNKDFHPWCLALIHGAVFIHECSLNGKLFRLSIISRRSTKRAGTRFFRRGCDSNGNVANFVETEQIVEHNDSLTSFVQIRGSLPFFWKQSPTLEYHVKPVIYNHMDHEKPFNSHLEKLVHNYGAQILVNLINQQKTEGELQQKYRQLHKSSPLSNHVDYEAFDFHAECSRLRYDRLNLLLGRMRDRLVQFGCFYQTRSIVTRLQTGVVRTNCMDSLDRTNVVQSLIAAENLNSVLKNVGILHNNDVIDNHQEFFQLFRKIWANHANFIALQYAGSEALKTDLTRTGKRTFTGMLRDLKTAIVRYYKNNFCDGRRQDAIDLVLGNYTVDVYETKKNKTKLFLLPLIVIMVLSMLFLSSLLFSETTEELTLLLICFLATTGFSILLLLRHSKMFVDMPHYCQFDFDHVLKL